MLDVSTRERDFDDLVEIMTAAPGDTGQRPQASSWEIIAIAPASVEPQGQLLSQWLNLRDHIRNTANVNPYDPEADEFTVTPSDEDDRDYDEGARLTSLSQKQANGRWSHLRRIEDVDLREQIDNTMLHDAEDVWLETPQSPKLIRAQLKLEPLISDQRVDILAEAVDYWQGANDDEVSWPDRVAHYNRVSDQVEERRRRVSPLSRKGLTVQRRQLIRDGRRAVKEGRTRDAYYLRARYVRLMVRLRQLDPQPITGRRMRLHSDTMPRKHAQRLQRTTSRVTRQLVQINGIWMQRHVNDDKAMDDPGRVFHTVAQHLPAHDDTLERIVKAGQAASDEDERDRLRALWLYETAVTRKRERRLAENVKHRARMAQLAEAEARR